jgi:hypothetical protein
MHGLREFGPDIWTADGPPVHAFGPVTLPTRMIVVKLSDGSLWINSPVSASRAELESLAQVGEVRFLVAPTRLHVWRLAHWEALFPGAEVWMPPGVSNRRQNRPFTNVLGDEPTSAWARDIDQLVFRGNLFLEEVEFLHIKSRTLIFADFVQNYHAQAHRHVLNGFLKLGGVLDGGVPRDIRLSFVSRDRGRESLRRLLSWDFDRLILAHGVCIERGAKAFVERAFRWLIRS